ncbi:MAG TPA: M20/M25/M40 family metallo-hydrolase, partial [Synergistales bacterium]|nr:M20/M25/M40 family metallo-hydrolase [Synergistales bacterium]
MFNENRKDELVGFCREMIRTPSLSGQEEKVAQLIAQKMENFGYDKVEFDEYGNVAGRIFLGEGGKTILLEGHMDHVEVSDPSKWTMDPFGAEIKNERIYGRATTDMKGNLSAMIYAGALVKQDLGKIINGEVVVAGSVHEECFEGIASESIG